MIHIMICDDEQAACAALQEAVVRWMRTNNRWDVSLRICTKAERVLELFENGLPLDLLLLDIQMPGKLDGMCLARKLREKDPHMSIAFITNYADYVFEGYTVSALRYLQKPVQDETLFECLDTAYRQHMLLSQESLLLDSPKQRLVLRYSDILYLESRMHQVEFHTALSDKPVSIRSRMDDFCTRLPSALFVRCHRSYVVNIARICSLSSSCVRLSSGAEIPVSKARLSELRTALERYYLQGGE